MPSASLRRKDSAAPQRLTNSALMPEKLRSPLLLGCRLPGPPLRMVDEMLVAQAQWLPQYAEAIEPARQRLASQKVKTREWSGAARKKVRKVSELQADFQANLMVEEDAFQV